MRFRGLAAGLFLLVACPAMADPAEGIWRTPPDRKNLTSYIQVSACGADLCGLILKAFDPSGKEVVTKNVGKRLFWGMRRVGDGVYSGGTAWVPLLDITVSGRMTLKDDTLRVTGCQLIVCNGQTWTRVK